MLQKSISAKVRPLSNASLEKASLLGAARLYVSKDSLLSLTGTLETGRACLIEKIGDDEGHPIQRQASLWILPEKNLSPNVVMMTRAFQDATGFKLGDLVQISLSSSIPEAEQVVAEVVLEEGQKNQDGDDHRSCWEYSISISLGRAEQVFPGMILEGVAINKLRKTYKVTSVNSLTDSLARFSKTATAVCIARTGTEEADPKPNLVRGDLVLDRIPGLPLETKLINEFLEGFYRSFVIQKERETCALVIHGGRGTGKTFILQRIAETNWGRPWWIKPSDKLIAIREVFKQAREQQPSLVFLDNLEKLLSKDRSNRESVIEAIGEELDILSETASEAGSLPQVVIIATCSDYLLDVPSELQRGSRFEDNVALSIPGMAGRLDILEYCNPQLPPQDREIILKETARDTHAYTSSDLTKLVRMAKKGCASRMTKEERLTAKGEERFLTSKDMKYALQNTTPSAMHDISLKPPNIQWKDIGGQDGVKKVLSRMIRGLSSANTATAQVLPHPPKGLLLYGPPGCSKTLSAQAMATESSFNFFAIKGAELLNMYVGESERALRMLFNRAKAASPSIIFFDEIDSISGQRSGPGSSAARSSGAVNMVTTLLTEMDGFEALKGVLVLAATNRPESIDPAILRPGRFDQRLYVGPPDIAAREAIFKIHLNTLSLADDVDFQELARISDGYSGAEIKAICHEAGLAVLDRVEDWDNIGQLEITMADLVGSLDNVPRNITSEIITEYHKWAKQFKKT